MIVSAWRIAAPDFSKSPQEMLSGEGAFLYGGRWNSKGVRVVYLGRNLALAAMELLVHLGRADVLNSYRKLLVWIPDTSMQHISLDDLPSDWADASMAPSVQAVGDAWVSEQSSLVLQVPSAVVRGEYNYLINPLHPDFNLITYGEITRFDFDPRLLK